MIQPSEFWEMTFREYYSTLLIKFPPDCREVEEKKVKQYSRDFFSDDEKAIMQRMIKRSEHR